MATLVLTVVGGAIGGPIGAAVGGAIGSSIDRGVLFKPKGRQGPRLTELALQTSSYGSPIPRLYGSMRVAGSVVWATDLKETRSKSGGGKGRPSATAYSYSASFAVLLSARAVQGIGRIWADGKLLRGAAGDFKSTTGFRLHEGGEDQAVDPLIAAAEGITQTPALRGQAYAVFEDLQLADYGNRIPSLTFEVVADAGPVTVATVATELGVMVADAGTPLDGFSAYGDSQRGVLETLAAVDGTWFANDGDAIVLRSGAGAAVAIGDDGCGAGRSGARGVRQVAAADTAPKRIMVAHYDPTRDYEAGLQRAERPGAGLRAERIDLPVALSAPAARAIADGMLSRAEAEREQRTVTLADDGLRIAPGDRVTIAGEPGLWRVTRWTLEQMVVRLTLARISRPAVASVATDAGRIATAPDQVHGPTVVHAFELPALDDQLLNAPRLTIVAAGGPGWRQAALLLSLDQGASWRGIGPATVPATIGTVVMPPGPGYTALIDRVRTIDVALLHDGMTLADADAGRLDAGANLALVGDELLQFGRAAALGDGRWRLSELWRGRRGTEWAAGAQQTGNRFVLIEHDALVGIDLPVAVLGTTVRVLASGVGDVDGPAAAGTVMTGASVRPPAPVGLQYWIAADGSAVVRGIRRSRVGWSWTDGRDAPLGEEAERYRVTVGARTDIVSSPQVMMTPAERSSGPVAVTIRQLGTVAESVATTLIVPGL